VTRAPSGIGRGLSAILSASGEQHGVRDELRELALESIARNPKQPRRRFAEEALELLAQSVGERGVLQPVLVRPRPGGSYELVAGERRLLAAQRAGLETIPAVVRERADTETLELAVIENMAREDLNPVEEARACAALVEELGLTRAEVGRRVGRSRVAISNLVRLLELPDEAIELIEQGALSEGHGRALLIAEDHGARRTLARAAAAEGWSVRALEARARDSNGSARLNGSAGRARSPRGGADRAEAASQIAGALSEALGAEVHVRPLRSGAYRVELTFASAAEALELARRVGASPAAA
jgi:ParB family transcriptional regulator, chromosome partitioning protein